MRYLKKRKKEKEKEETTRRGGQAKKKHEEKTDGRSRDNRNRTEHKNPGDDGICKPKRVKWMSREGETVMQYDAGECTKKRTGVEKREQEGR